jgi:hypothetical protein
MLEYPPQILESDYMVLEALAEFGSTNAYQIKEKTGKAYSLVFNVLKKLEKLGNIRLERKAKTEKNTIANVYALTLDGVLLILYREMRQENPNGWKQTFIRKTMEKYSFLLPLVFGKWEYLEKAGFEKAILSRLKITVDTHHSNPFRRGTGFYPWLEMQEQITKFFYFFDFYRSEHERFISYDFKEWIMTWEQDQEIRAFTTQELKCDQTRLKNMQVKIERILSFMERHDMKKE